MFVERTRVIDLSFGDRMLACVDGRIEECVFVDLAKGNSELVLIALGDNMPKVIDDTTCEEVYIYGSVYKIE